MEEPKSIPLTAETLAALEQYTDEDVETVLETLLETADDHRIPEPTSDPACEPPYDAYVEILEGIDTLAHDLLQEIAASEALDDDTKREAKRRLREVRAQVDPLLLTFRRQTDDGTVSDGGVAMLTRRGNGQVTHLGPDPIAFDRKSIDERGADDDE
ncbi:hypothetical protein CHINAEXTREME_14300 [Halobiforma lacisalsi AJ5]|uniref:Uncharacterized protein n=1 Tax=Natronobacterium lacisalsi AJ5 TaxID=358396 RepID=M0L2B3_NATLA|nr:hypothetical protein [Halobiforma lacisalsi]APW98875.1 hypothetical protein CHINAEXTREME_14300 [Halobiforma lacisalsi AJ5]EMA27238.1 hypothetical protein C445_21116 [Halobiforma lacisalsi AJ5]